MRKVMVQLTSISARDVITAPSTLLVSGNWDLSHSCAIKTENLRLQFLLMMEENID